ncbi:uncharacterized protein LOC133323089 [Musca vetustissima]|uniref:uncharacterized protein LOC133323089 n=1 Tax=Musca vetustissima TaxID=27455 RepID=UPI002AB73C2F|nr:uncharacterized protein LOC133323089 [Musca vetustissima]
MLYQNVIFWIPIYLLYVGSTTTVLAAQQRRRPFEIRFHNIVCNVSAGIARDIHCDVTKFATSRYHVNAEFTLQKELPRTAFAEMLITFRYVGDTRIRKFLTMKMNICDILSHIDSFPLIQMIMRSLTSSSNLPLSCPVKVNFTYKIKDLPVTDAFFPPYTQTIDFNFTLNFMNKKTWLAEFRLEGTTLRDTKKG